MAIVALSREKEGATWRFRTRYGESVGYMVCFYKEEDIHHPDILNAISNCEDDQRVLVWESVNVVDQIQIFVMSVDKLKDLRAMFEEFNVTRQLED